MDQHKQQMNKHIDKWFSLRLNKHIIIKQVNTDLYDYKIGYKCGFKNGCAIGYCESPSGKSYSIGYKKGYQQAIKDYKIQIDK